MGRVFYNKKFSDYLGENRAIMDIVESFVPDGTPAPSPTPSITPSNTPTPTPSITPSNTPSVTPTNTPSTTPSNTPSITPTNTPSTTPSNTPSVTPSITPSVTPSITPSITPSPSPGPSLDPDAVAYLNAVVAAGGTVDATMSGATDTLYKTLKTIGVYSKLKAFYPIIGGTAASHAVEGRSPGGAYNLTFNGSWIHTVKGMQTTAYSDSNYADTQYLPTILNPNSNHMFGYYNKRGSSGPNTYDGAGPAPYFILGHPVIEFFSSSAVITSVGSFTNYGAALGTRQASNITKVFRSLDGGDWAQGGGTNTTTPTTYPSNSITISKINAVGFSSNERYAFLSFGDGLSDTEGTNYYNAVLAFQTTLGRNTNA